MVASRPRSRLKGRFYYIAGCDGTGKSTQARLLLERLRRQGLKPVHLWLRYPFFFSIPFLAYARLRGYSRSEVVDGARHGYWNFQHSWLMRTVFPWVFLLDAALASVIKVYLPLWLGKIIVCERYILDMVVDLETGLNDAHFIRTTAGNLFLRLMPASAQIAVLDLDIATVKERRADLRTDWMLEERLSAFRSLAASRNFKMIPSLQSIETLHQELIYGFGL